MSAASLKGQLGVKSGPLAPTSAKWTTQMLVISHMENHYKKINKAKPAIDNKPPKSMMSGQKMRDRRSRAQIERYGSRPSSRPSSRMTSRMDSVEDDIYDEDQWDEPEDEDERKVLDIMRTTLRGPLKAQHGIFNTTTTIADGDAAATEGGSNAAGFGATTVMRPRSASLKRVAAEALRGGSGSRLGQTMTRPMSARSTTSLASLASNVSQTSRRSTAKQTYDGDVLDKHAGSFTQPSKPFTPRTLKSNRQSSLKQFKYYTPPPPKKEKAKAAAAANADGGDVGDGGDNASSNAPQVKPRRGRGVVQDMDMDKTQTLTETMLMDMSLQSHDGGRFGQGVGAGGDGVPPLDITMDKDHLSWVQDQAARAQGSGD